MGLRAYRATWLPSYAATCRGKQRGARNGTPRYICSLLLFSPEESLKAGSTACGHDIGELVILGCRATLLPSYLAIGSQHSPAGCWLLIDILAAPNRARIIYRAIDGRAGPYRTTCLPSSRPQAKQRGARNGTPQDSCLLLFFLSLIMAGDSSYSECAGSHGGHPPHAACGIPIKAPSPQSGLRPEPPHTR